MAFYVYCDDNNRHETLNKEEILSAIAQAQAGMPVIDPEAGILTKVKETNAGGYITFWVGTQAQYNALNGNIVQNCLYIITDENTGEEINNAIGALKKELDTLKVETIPGLQQSISSNKTIEKIATGATFDRTDVTVKSSDIRTYYNKTLGMARISVKLEFEANMVSAIDSIRLPKGLFKPVMNSEHWLYPLTCFCYI
jgi:hypothetical protein